MKYSGLPANAPRAQRKAKKAADRKRETWMARLGGQAGVSFSLRRYNGSNGRLFKHARGVGVHRGL